MFKNTIAWIFCFALVGLQLVSCAGGTRGSGVGTIEGRLVYVDGPAIPAVTVEAQDIPGVATATDSDGNFVLNFDGSTEPGELPDIITLKLDGQQILATITVSAPGEDTDVTVLISINPQTNGVSQVEESVQPRPTPTLAPTRTPSGPMATRTPNSGQSPGATRTPEPTRSAGPTSTPTVSASEFPTRTPTPSGTDTPTPTPRATRTPTPTPTGSLPTRTPTPTRTPR